MVHLTDLTWCTFQPKTSWLNPQKNEKFWNIGRSNPQHDFYATIEEHVCTYVDFKTSWCALGVNDNSCGIN